MRKMNFAAGLFVMIFAFAIFVTGSNAYAGCGSSHGKAEASKASESKDIIETAVAAEGFGTLVTAVKAAGLVEALQGEGSFTVFAPTDDAFAKLPKGTIEALLKDKEKLTAILTYHVVPGKVMAADVVKVKSAATLNGQEIAVNTKKGKVMIDNANVIATDIMCSNGVIHVIDAVILPQEEGKRSEK